MLPKLLTLLSLLFTASATHAELANSTRDVTLDLSHGAKVKYSNVPAAFTDQDIQHADLVGMTQTFSNGETWLTLDGKRLFLSPPDEQDQWNSTESTSEWPLMSPSELRPALARFPSYKELEAQWNSARGDSTLRRRDRAGCAKQQVSWEEVQVLLSAA
ncbi:hypothetical protein CDD80_1859 [Ophiocordyceps camponoti-rufipedis]|uniref:Uncharacterized protein n=1 Tax=Ophiocordyceps camponoti-rufipedis TaxID=2004952 RepID=A0A2C5Z8E6_9HYPO|nr:hypothetical protein CDD80_1859 [Ophiocordyceps camponoti-rufipedis]